MLHLICIFCVFDLACIVYDVRCLATVLRNLCRITNTGGQKNNNNWIKIYCKKIMAHIVTLINIFSTWEPETFLVLVNQLRDVYLWSFSS